MPFKRIIQKFGLTSLRKFDEGEFEAITLLWNFDLRFTFKICFNNQEIPSHWNTGARIDELY